MNEIAATLAHWLGAIMPGWLEIPNISFSPPHWLYWAGLGLFPLLAMFLLKKTEKDDEEPNRISLAIAGMLWFFGGFIGLHRFYLRAAKIGAIYVVLFLVMLYGSAQAGDARNALSNAENEVRSQSVLVERYARRVEQGRRGAEEDLAEARSALSEAERAQVEMSAVVRDWRAFAGFFGAVILLMLLHDLIRMRRLYARCVELEAHEPPPGEEIEIMERGPGYDPRTEIDNPVSRLIDRINGGIGRYVAYWSVLAVFVYYFEVISRYVFNSPTNWAHESMFLMFGMQYVLSGAYAMREGAHVRVDVIYERFSFRTRAIMDVVTSVFFFIFTITLLVTGIMFAAQSIGDNEASFNEWGIQYWPAKSMIAVGGLLLLLQGISHVIRDIQFLRTGGGRKGDG